MTTTATETRTYTIHDAHNPDDLLTKRTLWPDGLQKITIIGNGTFYFQATYEWDHKRTDHNRIIWRSSPRKQTLPPALEACYDSSDQNARKRVLVDAHRQLLTTSLKVRFQNALKAAHPAFDRYTNTLAALERTWEALQCTTAGVWNAAVLTLQQAQDTHQEAADKFDDLIHKAVMEATQWGETSPEWDDLNHFINEQGRGFAAVASALEDDYKSNRHYREDLSGVAAFKARKLIAHQRDQLARAAEMMPAHNTEKDH